MKFFFWAFKNGYHGGEEGTFGMAWIATFIKCLEEGHVTWLFQSKTFDDIFLHLWNVWRPLNVQWGSIWQCFLAHVKTFGNQWIGYDWDLVFDLWGNRTPKLFVVTQASLHIAHNVTQDIWHALCMFTQTKLPKKNLCRSWTLKLPTTTQAIMFKSLINKTHVQTIHKRKIVGIISKKKNMKMRHINGIFLLRSWKH